MNQGLMAGSVGIINDPNGPTYHKGSALREGRSLVGIGSTSIATLAAAGTSTFEFDLSEGGTIGKFVIGAADADLAKLKVTSLKVQNDELITGDMPATTFAKDSIVSPGMGHSFNINTKIVLVLANVDGTNATGPIHVGATVH